jgi:hypothetical protein
MQQEEWNEALLEWYFHGRPRERVYLRADDYEREKLNLELHLGLTSPADDLLDAVKAEAHGDASFSWLRKRSDEWHQRTDSRETPPFLAPLAASVLIVSRETDRGSLAFYEPFSRVLGLRQQLDGDEYCSSFFLWWVYLDQWLTEVNSGNRGFPSWRRIPEKGPRSKIGHPYSQVLLRREDLRDVDLFLASLGRLAPGDFVITDATAAAADLLDRLTRWAQRRKVSARLWEILFGESRKNVDSLQSMLLDRLLDKVEEPSVRPHERVAPLVVTLDDWTDRQLRFSALITSPFDFEPGQIVINGEQIGPLQVNEPYVVPIPVDSTSLADGLSLHTGDEVMIEFRPADVIILVAREWSLWCSVDDADAGEMAYVLASEGALSRFTFATAWTDASGIDDVPNGWRLFGPLELPRHNEVAGAGLPLRGEAQAVPRLVGGLEVARHAYLVGGPPGLWLPQDGASVSLKVDGQRRSVEGDASLVLLKSFDLGPGSHQVDVGPYRLSFTLLTVEQLPLANGDLLRTAVGDVVPAGHANGAMTFMGAIQIPSVSYDPLITCPLGTRVVVFGDPGVASECVPTMAPWAIAEGLTQALFEPMRPSSYSTGRHPFRPICWVAVHDDETCVWTVTQVEELSAEPQTLTISPDLARSLVMTIGESPSFRLCDHRSEDEILSKWITYASLVLEVR